MAETYIKVTGKDRYLYRAADSDGNTVDFLLTAKRDELFRKVLNAVYTQEPLINVDKNAAYPKATEEIKEIKELS